MDQTKHVTEWQSGLPETPCGKGSMFENTEIIREFIPQIVTRYGIKSIADVGCGDQNWIHAAIPDMQSRGINYVGYDIMPRRQGVVPFDVTREVLPEPVDLILCIYVLNHLRPDMAERAIRLLKESGAKYLLMSYSDGDQYAIRGMNFMEAKSHMQTKRHTWKYGVWEFL